MPQVGIFRRTGQKLQYREYEIIGAGKITPPPPLPILPPQFNGGNILDMCYDIFLDWILWWYHSDNSGGYLCIFMIIPLIQYIGVENSVLIAPYPWVVCLESPPRNTPQHHTNVIIWKIFGRNFLLVLSIVTWCTWGPRWCISA